MIVCCPPSCTHLFTWARVCLGQEEREKQFQAFEAARKVKFDACALPRLCGVHGCRERPSIHICTNICVSICKAAMSDRGLSEVEHPCSSADPSITPPLSPRPGGAEPGVRRESGLPTIGRHASSLTRLQHPKLPFPSFSGEHQLRQESVGKGL